MKYTVRATEDLAEVMKLDRQCFPHDSVKDMGDGELWLASADDGEPVGYASLLVQDNGAKAFLSRAGVIKAHRGQGLQKRLIRARISWARKHGIPRLYTYVWAGNIPSFRSLCSAGFLPYYCQRYPTVQPGVKITCVYLELKLKT